MSGMVTTIESTMPEHAHALPSTEGQALDIALAATLDGLLRSRGELLSMKHPSGVYVHVNEAMAAFLGDTAAGVIGRQDGDFFDPAPAAALRAAEQTAMAQAQPLLSEHRLDWRGERREFAVLRLMSPPDAQGRRWLCSVWTDQAERRQREAQLRAALEQIEQQQRSNDQLRREVADRALREPRSGLHRRGHFEDQLRREVDLSTREHREFAIVYIEVDPPAGRLLALGEAGRERILEAMGRLLRGGTRAMDASCHFDELRFAVLLSGVGLATAHARMEGLRRQCTVQIVVHEGSEFGFTVSVGVASFPHTAHLQGELTAACEAALAEAKRRGGNQVTLAAIQFERD